MRFIDYFLRILCYLCFVHAATDIIVTNHKTCTQLAQMYLQRFNATPPELAIVISVCEGIINPQDAGLGGGFQATVYNGYCNEQFYINARETSPASFDANDGRQYSKIGIPSVLKGYEYLYNMNSCGITSKVPWSLLFKLNIEVASKGFLRERRNRDFITYVDQSERDWAEQNGLFRNILLANTLRTIASEGPSSSLYKKDGYLHNQMVADLNEVNSFVTSSDILNYNVKVLTPFKYSCMKYKIATTRIPGSGFTFILGCQIMDAAMEQLKTLPRDARFLFMYHTIRYMYSLKPLLRSKDVNIGHILSNSSLIAYEILSTLNQPWPHKPITRFGHYQVPIPTPRQRRQAGTTNIIVKRGKYAITMTSTINRWYGSKLHSKRLGLFYNNQLDDFDEDNTPNRPKGGKHPQSAISATVLYSKKNNPVFQIGAAGGSSIIGSIFNTFFNYFVNEMNLEDANAEPRCFPNYEGHDEVVLCERGVPENILNIFQNFQIELSISNEYGYAAVTASSTVKNYPEAAFDRRRGGDVFIEYNSAYGKRK